MYDSFRLDASGRNWLLGHRLSATSELLGHAWTTLQYWSQRLSDLQPEHDSNNRAGDHLPVRLRMQPGRRQLQLYPDQSDPRQRTRGSDQRGNLVSLQNDNGYRAAARPSDTDSAMCGGRHSLRNRRRLSNRMPEQWRPSRMDPDHGPPRDQ